MKAKCRITGGLVTLLFLAGSLTVPAQADPPGPGPHAGATDYTSPRAPVAGRPRRRRRGAAERGSDPGLEMAENRAGLFAGLQRRREGNPGVQARSVPSVEKKRLLPSNPITPSSKTW